MSDTRTDLVPPRYIWGVLHLNGFLDCYGTRKEARAEAALCKGKVYRYDLWDMPR